MDVTEGLRTGGTTPPQPPFVTGYISTNRPAPVAAADQIFVVIPTHSVDRLYGPLDWPAIHGSTLPQQGAACTLGFDDNGTPLVVSWAATYLSPTAEVIAPYPSGGDDSPAITATAALLPASGGRIMLRAGAYRLDTGLNFDSTRNVTLRGVGGVTAGATGATVINYTAATGAAISARSTIGFTLEDVYLTYDNASYAGNLIDFSHATAADSSNFLVRRCFIGGGSSKLTAASLIFLDKANSGVIDGCLFSGGLVAILGRLTDNTHYSNANVIQNCSFVGFVTCHIRNPGDSWTIIGNTFENRVTSGGASAGAGSLGWSGSAFTTRGLSYIGNWHGDANTTGTWVSVTSALLLGATFTGNYFGSGSIGISLGVASLSGITIVGNTFDQMAFGIGINTTSSRAFLIHANTFTSLSSGPIGFGGGTMPADSVLQNEDATNVGGDLLGMVRLVAGAVSDGSFPVPPPNGTFGFDTTGLQLYFRTGGVWKKTAALT